MRLLRSWAVLVALCLLLGASVAYAEEAPSAPARREASGISRILGELGAFLKSVWDNTGCDIDPLGRPCSPGAGAPANDGPDNPSVDLGFEIDPWG